MATGDVAKLIVHLQAGSSNFRPGLHFQAIDDVGTMNTLIDGWRSAVETFMLAAMSNELSLVAYEAQDREPGTLASVIVPIEPALPGTALEPMLPPQDAVLFSHRSALKSPRARGRSYWPGATETQNEGGSLSTAAQGTWVAFGATILQFFGGAAPVLGWRVVNYSPEELDPPKPPPVFKPRPGTIVTPVTTMVLDPVLRSQRRRQIGVGQ